ncbi:fatty acyl-CoA synthetase [Caenimonas aquaedulcis]|uniref:Long-chain-fatty-acid--CoA ligase n=1 Tax=Caenimonas aquaedulcis TaxID=2793270 RepID=A0A931MGT8_9BURK|nr:fatty acyl-CoA synthetase [Caenimonas aquaedulcis]MBG9388471.1 long-chain-fatty-acid--CoA ligase [Caenimonas aquaedulcis]
MDPAIRRQTIADLLHRTAKRFPRKPGLMCGATQWTFAEFDAVVDRVAAGLSKMGVAHAGKVAVLARNSHGFAALRFALARLGAVMVPINFMLKAEEVAYILRHAGAQTLATDSGLAEVARAAAAMDTSVKQFIWLPSEDPSQPVAGMTSFDELARTGGPAPAMPQLASTDLAQIVYTSGTESMPKGAMLTHDAVISQYASCAVDANIASGDVLLHALPLYHCAQLDVFLGPAIYVGATSIVTAKPTPDNLLPLIAKHGITSFFAPPTVWIALLRSPLLDATDMRSLRKGYYGASIMPVEVLKELARRLPGVGFWNLYGQTEIAPLATMLGPQDQLRKPGSCGRAVLNVETRVVDEDLRDVKPGGEVGEIVHRSPHLMLGYFHDEEKTKAAFAGGWFHSGDLATIDDEGFITVVDRKKDMIKSGGENVASREVEEMIYKLPAVSEVAVIGVPDAKWVEAVAAVVVVKAGQSLTEAEVIAHCAKHMAGFKAPKRVIFAESLPKNPSGKLLKRELRERYAR